jgi:hypothetical protein
MDGWYRIRQGSEDFQPSRPVFHPIFDIESRYLP